MESSQKIDIHHFYHIHCDNEKWEGILLRHIEYLSVYNLNDNLSSINFGIVGSEKNRVKVKNILNQYFKSYNIVSETDDGWEQETLDKLYEFSKNNTGYVLYMHTKSAVNYSELHDRWNIGMSIKLIKNWKEVVEMLNNDFSIVGCHYLDPLYGEFIKLQDTDKKGYFAGNFWWTSLEYINKLNYTDRYSRYRAEVWICDIKDVVEALGKKFKVYDYIHVDPTNHLRHNYE